MTVSEAEENQPLLAVGLGNIRRSSYSSQLCSDKDANGLTIIPHAIITENQPTIEFKYGTISSSGPTTPIDEKGIKTPFNKGITYTWNDINVYTTEVAKKKFSLSRIIRSLAKKGRLPPRQRKHILKNVNGVAYPGELLAIMGSSGAGKTTLLNTLTFRSASSLEISGTRAVNGYPVSSNTMTCLSAYVQQEDLFIGNLTVREHLIFQALVRMDREIPYRQRMIRVDEVISELALTKCQNTMIGVPGIKKGISGGEMKRLAFASEVLTDPPLMFCDEPTSGLDSFMAQNVVSVLKSMARKGKTVICTIHQPSSEMFELFDKILLMAEGRVAFLGRTDDACLFFKELGAPCPSNYNPADFFIQMLAVVPNKEKSCKETITLICDTFDRSPDGLCLEVNPDPEKSFLSSGWTSFELWEENPWAQMTKADKSPYKASWLSQFRAVLWRSWLSVIKEQRLFKFRLMQTVLVALVISVIYYRQNITQDGVMNLNGALFTFLTNMTFQNVFAVINVFCSELPIFMREHHNGMYRVDVYFLCKTLAELPIFLAIPITFTSVVYFTIGLNPGLDHFIIANIIVCLVANVATSFGYLISSISANATMALAIGPPVMIPFLLFGGFLLNNRSIPPYFTWFSYLSWFKYGNEALLINQWSDIDYIDCSGSNSTCPRNGEIVLEVYGFEKDNLFFSMVCLFLLIVLYRFLAFLALLSKTLNRK